MTGTVTTRLPARLRRGILIAPVVFVVHFLEESPTFVPWFNAHVQNGITQGLFWTVNLGALLITAMVVLALWLSNSAASLVLAIAWLSFLMLTNAIFHITGAVVDRGYVPGLVTAALLYVPYCAWLGLQVLHNRSIPTSWMAISAALGGFPMAVHGYRTLFLGTRLF